MRAITSLCAAAFASQEPAPPAARTDFVWPCEEYLRGIHGRGNFGVLVKGDRRSPFDGTFHLAEDVWLPAGTEVVSVADGCVKYSAFSPTWVGKDGVKHWNLGNVIVVEHVLEPPEGSLTHVCSVYVHLAKDRSVAVGDKVKRGQRIGRIGADRSEENGDYPAHLHFGIHQGAYFQVAQSWLNERIVQARTIGVPVDDPAFRTVRWIKGEAHMKSWSESSIVLALDSGEISVMSILTGSTAPVDPPPDLIHWCHGYGSEAEVKEWLRPSAWIQERMVGK